MCAPPYTAQTTQITHHHINLLKSTVCTGLSRHNQPIEETCLTLLKVRANQSSIRNLFRKICLDNKITQKGELIAIGGAITIGEAGRREGKEGNIAQFLTQLWENNPRLNDLQCQFC
jgi:hypothetical protein